MTQLKQCVSEKPFLPVKRAIVLAAGLGTRMRPLTEHMPKPMVPVCGVPLIDYSLDRLVEAGIEEAVVNVHYLADQLEAHLATRSSPRIVISDERAQLLETAGGIKQALPLLAPDHETAHPFLILNSDELWVDGAASNIERMLATWNPEQMDILLLLASSTESIGYHGKGDFLLDDSGGLIRRTQDQVAPHVYAGVAIVKPELFNDIPDGPVSMNLLFDRAIVAKRLFGLPLEGTWLHVGTVEVIAEAERCLETLKNKTKVNANSP